MNGPSEIAIFKKWHEFWSSILFQFAMNFDEAHRSRILEMSEQMQPQRASISWNTLFSMQKFVVVWASEDIIDYPIHLRYGYEV